MPLVTYCASTVQEPRCKAAIDRQQVIMGTARFARGVMRAFLAAAFLALASTQQLVAGQETTTYSKFLLFFQLLDNTGTIAAEYAAADGDLCQMDGVECENGNAVKMCALICTAKSLKLPLRTVSTSFVMRRPPLWSPVTPGTPLLSNVNISSSTRRTRRVMGPSFKC